MSQKVFSLRDEWTISIAQFPHRKKEIAYHETNFREAERASFDRWLLADSAQGVGFPQIEPKFKIQSFDFAYSKRNFS